MSVYVHPEGGAKSVTVSRVSRCPTSVYVVAGSVGVLATGDGGGAGEALTPRDTGAEGAVEAEAEVEAEGGRLNANRDFGFSALRPLRRVSSSRNC